jgi:hypothetical protein
MEARVTSYLFKRDLGLLVLTDLLFFVANLLAQFFDAVLHVRRVALIGLELLLTEPDFLLQDRTKPRYLTILADVPREDGASSNLLRDS